MERTALRQRAKLRAGKPLQRKAALQRTTSMAASDAQRAAVAGRCCIVCGANRRVDPAHLVSRAMGVLCPPEAVLSSAVIGTGLG
jgi:hypothetical protein